MAENPYSHHEICSDCADSHDKCDHGPAVACAVCAWQQGHDSRNEEVKALGERLKRAESTCATVYQWAVANRFPVEILDNLSRVAEGDDTDQNSAPWHDALPQPVDLLAPHEAEISALREAKDKAQEELSKYASIEGKAHLQTIDERDKAEEALNQAYFLITGNSPEWSNNFGFDEAVGEIDDFQKLLRNENKRVESDLTSLREVKDKAEAACAEMRQTLGFYAETYNYAAVRNSGDGSIAVVMQDRGRQARIELLKKDSGSALRGAVQALEQERDELKRQVASANAALNAIVEAGNALADRMPSSKTSDCSCEVCKDVRTWRKATEDKP